MGPEGPIRLDMNNPKFQEQLLTRPGPPVLAKKSARIKETRVATNEQ